MRSGHVVRESCSSRIRHRNALTERAWKDAVHQTSSLQEHAVTSGGGSLVENPTIGVLRCGLKYD